MKMTNREKQVAVCNQCFPTSNKVVRTNTEQRALASRGAK